MLKDSGPSFREISVLADAVEVAVLPMELTRLARGTPEERGLVFWHCHLSVSFIYHEYGSLLFPTGSLMSDGSASGSSHLGAGCVRENHDSATGSGGRTKF